MYSPTALKSIFSGRNVTMNNHRSGITPEHFASYSSEAGLVALSTNADRNGKVFLSSMEHKTAPIFGVQFHPEKNPFEKGVKADGSFKEAIDHSVEAVAAAEYLASFFIEQAKRNTHAFPSTSVLNAALTNGRSTSTVAAPAFSEIYLLFDN